MTSSVALASDVRRSEPQPGGSAIWRPAVQDVVFPDAPRVEVYAHWSYVLVEAGPDQAAEWRARDPWGESSPDVMSRPIALGWSRLSGTTTGRVSVAPRGSSTPSFLTRPWLSARMRRIPRCRWMKPARRATNISEEAVHIRVIPGRKGRSRAFSPRSAARWRTPVGVRCPDGRQAPSDASGACLG
jgi:hypothetical protein